jgi:putative ABC transport system substrate-binding protein
LRGLGWSEGQNITLEYRYNNGRLDLLPNLAADLVNLKVDLIVAWAAPEAGAAEKATKTIPSFFWFTVTRSEPATWRASRGLVGR